MKIFNYNIIAVLQVTIYFWRKSLKLTYFMLFIVAFHFHTAHAPARYFLLKGLRLWATVWSQIFVFIIIITDESCTIRPGTFLMKVNRIHFDFMSTSRDEKLANVCNILCSSGLVSHCIPQKLGTKGNVNVPVLLNEALVLLVRLDGLQGVGHFSVNTHYLIMKQIRQIKIFLQNLLPKKKPSKPH